MDSLITALALALALLFTSSGPGPVGIIDHGEDGVWALECVYPDSIELMLHLPETITRASVWPALSIPLDISDSLTIIATTER